MYNAITMASLQLDEARHRNPVLRSAKSVRNSEI